MSPTDSSRRGRDPHRYMTLTPLFRDMASCAECPLAGQRSRVVPGVGPADAPLMFVGEGPGAEEDRRGEPFVGAAGRLLDELLAGAGLRRGRVFITNVVACRPPGNRVPRVGEVRAHAPWLEAQIRIVAPRIICTLGRTALDYFQKGEKITEVHGRPRAIRHEGRPLTLLPTYHPAAGLRMRRLVPELESDFRKLAELVGRIDD